MQYLRLVPESGWPVLDHLDNLHGLLIQNLAFQNTLKTE